MTISERMRYRRGEGGPRRRADGIDAKLHVRRTSRVVASLCSVDDELTAGLIARLYKTMEQDKMSPAAALRAAPGSGVRG